MRAPVARLLRTTLGLAAALLLAACTAVQGSGKIITEERPVSGFTTVELDGTGTLIITQGESEALAISTDDNVLPLITSEVRGDTLALGPRAGASFTRISELTYKLTVKDLRAVKVNGSADVDAQQIASASLRVALNGSGSLKVSGTTDELEVDINGSGSFDGPDLASQTVRVSISGSGDVTVNAAEALDVAINGSGSVSYLGSPRITQQINGSGSINPR